MYDNNYNFQKIASKVIYEHKELFIEHRSNNRKLNAIKDLKELTGGGLKECKDALDLYFIGELKPYILEERKIKLENLAKSPLINQIILKIKKSEDERLYTVFMKLTVDDLLLIDESFFV